MAKERKDHIVPIIPRTEFVLTFGDVRLTTRVRGVAHHKFLTFSLQVCRGRLELQTALMSTLANQIFREADSRSRAATNCRNKEVDRFKLPVLGAEIEIHIPREDGI